MRITVFRKVAKSKDGRAFDVYVSKLRKKDGSEQYVSVKFRKEVQLPAEFPAIIEVSKDHANLAKKSFDRENGEKGERYTLWIDSYIPTGEKYVDHSLEDFE